MVEILDAGQVVDPHEDELARAYDKIANLEMALVSARRIGMAVGILMARHGLTDEHAFDRLRHASQHYHRKVRDIAEEVIFTGALEDSPVTSTPKATNSPLAALRPQIAPGFTRASPSGSRVRNQ